MIFLISVLNELNFVYFQKKNENNEPRNSNLALTHELFIYAYYYTDMRKLIH